MSNSNVSTKRINITTNQSALTTLTTKASFEIAKASNDSGNNFSSTKSTTKTVNISSIATNYSRPYTIFPTSNTSTTTTNTILLIDKKINATTRDFSNFKTLSNSFNVTTIPTITFKNATSKPLITSTQLSSTSITRNSYLNLTASPSVKFSNVTIITNKPLTTSTSFFNTTNSSKNLATLSTLMFKNTTTTDVQYSVVRNSTSLVNQIEVISSMSTSMNKTLTNNTLLVSNTKNPFTHSFGQSKNYSSPLSLFNDLTSAETTTKTLPIEKLSNSSHSFEFHTITKTSKSANLSETSLIIENNTLKQLSEFNVTKALLTTKSAKTIANFDSLDLQKIGTNHSIVETYKTQSAIITASSYGNVSFVTNTKSSLISRVSTPSDNSTLLMTSSKTATAIILIENLNNKTSNDLAKNISHSTKQAQTIDTIKDFVSTKITAHSTNVSKLTTKLKNEVINAANTNFLNKTSESSESLTSSKSVALSSKLITKTAQQSINSISTNNRFIEENNKTTVSFIIAKVEDKYTSLLPFSNLKLLILN